MAKLKTVHSTPTIDALKEAIENNKTSYQYFIEPVDIINGKRKYLGMSAIGDDCERKLYYSFCGAENREISSSGHLAIQDGHIQEQLFIERVKLFLPFINLITQERGEQIGFKDHKDHFRGHADGVIKGILEAPTTWHIWEHKSVNQKKFDDIIKKIDQYGEKEALKQWDKTYYAQGQAYMHYSGLTRHYMTISTPGGRDYTSIRTNYNKDEALYYIKRAEDLIFNNDLPAKMSEKPEFFKCKWCEFSEICHFDAVSVVGCKSCQSCEPIEEGQFLCKLTGEIIKDVFNPCNDHIFKKSLVNKPLLNSDNEYNLYKIDNEKAFCNCSIENAKKENDDKNLFLVSSKELREQIKYFNKFDTELIRSMFDGENITEKQQEEVKPVYLANKRGFIK